jgi:hypothetical protein
VTFFGDRADSLEVPEVPRQTPVTSDLESVEAEKGSFRNVLNKFIISNILLPVIATVDDMIHPIGSFNS